MLIKLGCIAEITVASFLILLGHCLQAVMTTTVMCRGIVIIQYHQSQNHSILNNTEKYSASEAKRSSANRFKVTFQIRVLSIHIIGVRGQARKGYRCREIHYHPIHVYVRQSQVTTAPTTVPHPPFKRLHSLLIKHSNAMNYWSEADVINWILLLGFYWWGKTCYSS